MLLTLWFLVGVALLFDFLNGMHDAANSIATIVSTRVLSPRAAVVWAAGFNFIAFVFFGLHVANTVGSGIVSVHIVTDRVIFGALGGAIAWNIITWLGGIPSSSSHALVGGLVGAGLAKAGTKAIVWQGVGKTAAGIVVSPVMGFALALVLVLAVSWIFVRSRPVAVDRLFRRLQFVSASLYSLGHGGNDAQKTMGIIAVLLYVHAGGHGQFHVPLWVVLACQTAMALGTFSGGWRIVHTMGSEDHPPDPHAGLLRRDRRRDHPVRGHLSGDPCVDDPYHHGRDHRGRRRAAHVGRSLGGGAGHRHGLGHHHAGRRPDCRRPLCRQRVGPHVKRGRLVGIQYAALPYRQTGGRVSILLVSSREHPVAGSFPSGWPGYPAASLTRPPPPRRTRRPGSWARSPKSRSAPTAT